MTEKQKRLARRKKPRRKSKEEIKLKMGNRNSDLKGSKQQIKNSRQKWQKLRGRKIGRNFKNI